MNDTLTTIRNRRSTRKFRSDDISPIELDSILEAGQYAPSAKNEQSWHFTVIKSRPLLQILNESCKSVLLSSHNDIFQKRLNGADVKAFDLFYHAPLLIVVSGNAESQEPQINCALAMENMFLAAESLDIGSCWIYAINHLFYSQDGKNILFREKILPPGFTLIGAGAFGYKADVPKNPSPRKAGVVTYLL